MNTDQTKGHIEEAKGKAKEVVGKLFGNKGLEQKGQLQNINGKVQVAFADVKEAVEKAIRSE